MIYKVHKSVFILKGMSVLYLLIWGWRGGWPIWYSACIACMTALGSVPSRAQKTGMGTHTRNPALRVPGYRKIRSAAPSLAAY